MGEKQIGAATGSPVSRARYRTIVADPPWSYRVTSPRARVSFRAVVAEHHYPTMTNSGIAALPVGDLAAKDAHLYMWVTNPKLYGDRARKRRHEPNPCEIGEGWGFEYVTALTWHKLGALGMGFYFRGETEHVLFFKRGNAPIPVERRERNWFEAQKHGHSEKPDSFMDLVERVSPGPYLEMFSRRGRLGWDTWGNESLGHVEMAS